MINTEKKEWAVVTGATSGIGFSTVRVLAEKGMNVIIHYHSNKDAAEKLAADVEKTYGVHAAIVGGDFSRKDEVYRAMGEAVKAIPGGKVDVLVNNAGSLIGRHTFENIPDGYWEEVISLNLSSAYYCTHALFKHFNEGARIVMVSSIAAENGGGPGAFAYAAAKGGMISMTRGLSKEFAGRGIRVNAVTPGVIETPYHEKFSTKERLRDMQTRIPMGRLGSSEECATVIGFLVSDESSYITGAVVPVNGGQGLM